MKVCTVYYHCTSTKHVCLCEVDTHNRKWTLVSSVRLKVRLVEVTTSIFHFLPLLTWLYNANNYLCSCHFYNRRGREKKEIRKKRTVFREIWNEVFLFYIILFFPWIIKKVVVAWGEEIRVKNYHHFHYQHRSRNYLKFYRWLFTFIRAICTRIYTHIHTDIQC